MALAAKKTEADHLRELERSQPEEIEKAERVVGRANAGPAPISVRLSKPLLEELDYIAARKHRTRSNLIQHILWTYVISTRRDTQGTTTPNNDWPAH